MNFDDYEVEDVVRLVQFAGMWFLVGVASGVAIMLCNYYIK